MKIRNQFPLDWAALLSVPLISVLIGSLFPIINWFRHPTAHSWLWAVGIATCTSLLGAVLLFFAKLPQYRAGIFLRVGCQHLPPRQQRLYHASFWLIVPSIFVLLALLSAVKRFQ
jgi:hypothetical protein